MELTLTQRNIIYALASNGYVGNWYKSPGKLFLRVYIHNDESDISMRYNFSVKDKIMDISLNDPTKLFYSVTDEDYKKFEGAYAAIKQVCPSAFKYFQK